MSGISTTQSKIAEDLDSFIYASWFSSAYLVSGLLRSVTYFDADLELDRTIKSCPSVCSTGADLLSKDLYTCLGHFILHWWTCHFSSPDSAHLPFGQSYQWSRGRGYDDDCLYFGPRVIK
jgi:hypothetical protein